MGQPIVFPTIRLSNKVPVITGAASGIGRASAIIFAREGAKVAVCDIDDAGGQETVSQIKSKLGEAIYGHVDDSLASDLERLIQGTVETFGRIDTCSSLWQQSFR